MTRKRVAIRCGAEGLAWPLPVGVKFLDLKLFGRGMNHSAPWNLFFLIKKIAEFVSQTAQTIKPLATI